MVAMMAWFAPVGKEEIRSNAETTNPLAKPQVSIVPKTPQEQTRYWQERYGLDERFYDAMKTESVNFNPRVAAGIWKGQAGEVGTPQFLPDTFAGMKIKYRRKDLDFSNDGDRIELAAIAWVGGDCYQWTTCPEELRGYDIRNSNKNTATTTAKM